MAGSGAVWVHPQEHKIVGQTLAQIRRRMGLRQSDVAARLDKPQSFVSAYEAGQRRIDVLELVRISAALGVDVRVVFTEIVSACEASSQHARNYQ